MTSSRRAFLAVLLWGALLLTGHARAQAQEPIRFARLPDISPDGKLVAFSYLGDIWTVETIGGIARPVTMHQAHDTAPVFSPDGKWLAFSSNRHGSYDVFVVPVYGGRPRRLTFDSAPDMVCGWSPDGKQILFTSRRGTDFPNNEDLYTVPFEGGRERRITFAQGKEGVFSPTGDRIAYVRGQVDWYRKGYRGSSNDDVWVCNADGANNVQVTTFNGQDDSPMWSPDGQFLYYVSDFHATPDKPHSNIVRQPVGSKGPPSLVTFHKDESVRRARISRNGEWIVYECGPDLFVVNTHEGSSPRKLAIEVHADDKANTEVTKTFTDGATEFALAHDEKHIAFVVHGDIFMMPLGSGGKVTRLTDSGAYDHGLAWAPDSSKMIFTSDRGGHEDLYLLEADDPDHPKFVEAKKFKVTQLTNTPEAEAGVQFSPDGKLVTFLRAGKLYSMKPDGTDLKTIVNDVQVIDYEWSPDSKWLCYARMDGSFASELYIIPAGGFAAGDSGRNVTRHATYNAGVTWSARGNKIAFLSERRQGLGLYVLALQKPAADGAASSSDIDWDDIHLRVSAPSPLPADEGAISADGSKVAFRAGNDLWVASTEGSQVSRITNNGSRPTQITWSRRNSDVLYFRDGKGSLRILRLGGLDALASLLAGPRSGSSSSSSSGPQPVEIPFRVKMTIRQDEEFSEMLEQSWRALQESFYDANFHGIDWHTVRAKYRPLVKHVAMKEDLYALVSLMMGELNASHLGIYGFSTTPEEYTGDLGLIFDESYRGPGLKIAEILKRGPADRRGMNLKVGDLIRSLDGTDITEQTNLSQLLNGKVGESVVLQVTSSPTADPKDPKAWRRVEVHPAGRGTIQGLMYDRWVERNAKRVAELSKGKVGYIHIPSMDEAGLDHFVRALYSDNFDKEAIVLDVRYNGGGFTHDQVLNYLGGKEHAIFRHREGGEGLVLRSSDRKWTKPLALLINQRSYSDAEIFPNAFRTLGLGKLVGVPTGGYVIGTGSTRLIDGSLFRVPRIGVYTTRGVNMEKEGVPPDVFVDALPDQLAHGLDPQLDRAVEVVQADVVAWKKAHQPNLAQKPAEGKAAPAPAPAPASPQGMK
jgi:tricorn protease